MKIRWENWRVSVQYDRVCLVVLAVPRYGTHLHTTTWVYYLGVDGQYSRDRWAERSTNLNFLSSALLFSSPPFLSFFLSRVVVRLSYYPFVSQQDIFLHVDSIFPRLITSNLTCGLIIEIHGFIGAQYLYRYLYQQDTLNLITRVMPTYQAYILCIIFKNCHLLTCHLSPYCCISTIFFSFFFKIFVI